MYINRNTSSSSAGVDIAMSMGAFCLTSSCWLNLNGQAVSASFSGSHFLCWLLFSLHRWHNPTSGFWDVQEFSGFSFCCLCFLAFTNVFEDTDTELSDVRGECVQPSKPYFPILHCSVINSAHYITSRCAFVKSRCKHRQEDENVGLARIPVSCPALSECSTKTFIWCKD